MKRASPAIGLKRRQLPNGMEVSYQSKAEVDYFYQDIFEKRIYVKNGISIEPGDCVFDVGANIGLFTLFVHTYFEDVETFSFEPAPPLFEILKTNTSFQVAKANLFNCGLSDVEKTSEFTFYPNSSGMSSFYADVNEEKDALRSIMANQMEKGMAGMEQLMKYADDLLEERLTKETYECRLTTLSSVLRARNVKRIDLLKIDVQKSELDILQGIDEGDWERIRQIVIEVHDINDRLDRISALLGGHGFDLVIEQDDLYQGSIMYNVYAVKPATTQEGPLLRRRINTSSVERSQDRARKFGESLNHQRELITQRRKGK